MEAYLRNLLLSQNEKQIFIVKKVEINNEIDIIEVDLTKNDSEYKGLLIVKGLTFPIPKLSDNLLVENIILKCNEEFDLKLYIEGKVEINPKKEEDKEITTIKKTFSFKKDNIYDTLSKILNEKLPSFLFSILKILKISNNIIELKDIFYLNTYNLEVNDNQINSFIIDDYLLIYNYEIENDKNIILKSLTTFEILNEEKLINYFNNNYYEDIDIFKVIDQNNDYYLLINAENKVYTLDKKNKKISDYIIYLYCIILITNYKINKGNKFDEIHLTRLFM